MPTSVTCQYNGQEIRIDEALEYRKNQKSPLFLCVNCGERVKVHAGGGHTGAHFEHFNRNPECPLSHSDSYKYGGVAASSNWQNPDADSAIEGYTIERKYLAHYRNADIVLKCKERDKHTCRSCGFSLRVNGKSVVECHHLVPLANSDECVTSVDALICLCPTCHRIAHTSNPPLSLKEITNLMTGKNPLLR